MTKLGEVRQVKGEGDRGATKVGGVRLTRDEGIRNTAKLGELPPSSSTHLAKVSRSSLTITLSFTTRRITTAKSAVVPRRVPCPSETSTPHYDEFSRGLSTVGTIFVGDEVCKVPSSGTRVGQSSALAKLGKNEVLEDRSSQGSLTISGCCLSDRSLFVAVSTSAKWLNWLVIDGGMGTISVMWSWGQFPCRPRGFLRALRFPLYMSLCKPFML
ncbi:hypothetical protein TREMEDRAFT_66563 [Tremella mesenterica DSM 1558]|uniref:uncharacterized protein n=1 Tax=Tremella mesenterica (strain ATCC 24925 / CBS 8224 / DSM 1558 / NBRC 9311 / NRRL Y-6157 / RJB 2259-6 / UBC 559-6) TaxID=578456 RepID=UPI00032BD8F9|nr:uncharacterized protein TREMEDRAFT_66563 [Tremella mesenterica DSM 1558]EIW65434.1 hypothetical protein TREMEDRAFT_66563 [Tremella mesenterica DSM 1558]